MAETLISPGVLASENDNSFISQGPITVGAAIIGPTVKGPYEIPTIVTSYSALSGTTTPETVWHNPPQSATDYGEEGWMAYDDNFHYIYINGKWLRQPLANFSTF